MGHTEILAGTGWNTPRYFEHISGRFRGLMEGRKLLTDAGLELVPRDGIEPLTRGFSIPFCLISATAWSEITSCKTRTHQRFQPFLIFVHGVHGVPDIPRNYPCCTHKPCTHLTRAWPGKVGGENRHAPGGSSHVPQPDRNHPIHSYTDAIILAGMGPISGFRMGPGNGNFLPIINAHET